MADGTNTRSEMYRSNVNTLCGQVEPAFGSRVVSSYIHHEVHRLLLVSHVFRFWLCGGGHAVMVNQGIYTPQKGRC